MQPDEEAKLVSLFADKGFAIEVGAADGVFTSPTYPLEKRGWKVICVEPNPIFAAKARQVRNMVIEAACSDFNAKHYPFTLCNVDHNCRLHEMQGGSALDVKHEHLNQLGWTPKGTREIKVEVRTLDSILSLLNWRRLDFLSIDTEGTEDAVLRGLDLEKVRPRVIVVENWPGVNKSDHILLPLGYKRIERVTGNFTDWYTL
jgi:FkbM family methyltransferase